MTVADVMDAAGPAGEPSGLVEELRAINQKLDRIEGVIDAVTLRVESLEDMRSDLWPMVHGASNAVSRKLHELEQNGALGFAKESVRVAERVATAFDEEDVRLLGENVVAILETVRNLTQREVLEVADRAAVALRDSDAQAPKKLSLWRAMRDPEIRRGMTMMLSVLREMGSEGNGTSAALAPAEEA